MTPKEKELVRTKVCASCGKEKDRRFYYTYKSCRDGLSPRCKICHTQGLEKKTEIINNGGRKRNQDGPALFNVSRKDWIQTYELLEKMGYDLNNDLHIQFCEKHNLEPKRRTPEKSLIFSPKDLGMV